MKDIFLEGTAGYRLNSKTGEAEKCENSICTLLYNAAYPGDRILLEEGFSGNSCFQVNMAIYIPERNPKYIYTYDYQKEESWTRFRDLVRLGSQGYCFTEPCYFRLAVESRDGTAGESLGEIIQWQPGGQRGKPGIADSVSPDFSREESRLLRQIRRKRSGDSLQFLLLSDSHYTVNGTWGATARNLQSLATQTALDGIIHLGDLTDGMVPKSVTSAYVRHMQDDMMKCGLPFYYVMGNHDTNYFRGNPEQFSEEEMERLYYSREPKDATREKGQFYYYRDFIGQNIRCIFLDSFDSRAEIRYGFSEKELDWLEQILFGTPEGYCVVLFSHVPPVERLHYWSKEIRGSGRLSALLRQYQRTSGGRLLGFIHGHNHADQVDFAEGFPIVSVGCGKCEYFEDKKPPGAYCPVREPGKVTQELWDVLTVSAKGRSMDFTRFGAGQDRHIHNGRIKDSEKGICHCSEGKAATMKKVITYGTFDLFHEGHYSLLKRAKALGEYLIVGVTTEHFDEQRGKLNVMDSLMERIEHVKKTGFADEIIIEDHEGQKIEDIQKYKIDIFAIGDDWKGTFDYLKSFCSVVYLERTPGISSTVLRKQKFSIVRAGIVGTGRIAPRFLAEANFVSGISVCSAYNPHRESAERFAKKHRLEGYCGAFEEFLGTVDAIYIASPHETHYGYAKRALLAGKHVLCEKPLALTRGQAEELFVLAQEKRLVLMEGIKTAYCPGFVQLVNAAKSGKIGEVRDVEACFSRLTAPNLREMKDRDYGGAFMEFGSYTLLPALKLFGPGYESVEFDSIPAGNGVDLYTKAQLKYKEGFALSKTGIGVKSEGQLLVAGTEGYILAEAPWWLTKKFEIHYEDPDKVELFTPPFMGDGLRYEISSFVSRIHGRGGQEFKLTKEESLVMAEVVERFMEKRKRERQEEKRRNRGSGVHIWAHRGCSWRYPENTLAAFEAACRMEGIAGIELDVQLTKDGRLAVFHDGTLDRLTEASGAVGDYTMKELKALRFRDWDYGNEGAQTLPGGGAMAIPALEEVLQMAKPYVEANGIRLNIELKERDAPVGAGFGKEPVGNAHDGAKTEGMERKLLSLVEQYGLKGHVLYSSFHKEILKKLKMLDGACETAILGMDMKGCLEAAAACRQTDSEAGVDGLHPNVQGLCQDAKTPAGIAVRVWNAEEPFYKQDKPYVVYHLYELAEKGVTDLITNVPEEYL